MSHPLPQPVPATEVMLAHQIGSRIRERRAQLGLSLKDLSARAGLPNPSIIEQLEAETPAPVPAWQLTRIARALHLTLIDLLAEDPLPAVPEIRWSNPPWGER
jgi:transcriptional regulator with XRE-family HTH domain